MRKTLVLALAAMVFSTAVAVAQTSKVSASTEIQPAARATNIGPITRDSVTVITGSTYLFSVDTPEDQGLVSTKIGVEELPLQLTSKDGSTQKYRVVDRNGAHKTSGEIGTGDRLVVTSALGQTRSYSILVKPMALSGQLVLERTQVTVGSTRNIVLYFTAGQRTPNATVNLSVPAGITVTMENTSVNVIGRGAVKLKDLATQSIGRVGTNYSYSRVGDVVIKRATGGGSLIQFTGLDLRPANGADLRIEIENVKLARAGNYAFSVNYTTAKPEVLTSAGVGAESATLSVTRTISDLERLVDRSLQYKETSETYTSAKFKWGASGSQSLAELMQSTDEGRTWTRSSASVEPKTGTANVTGLRPGQLYMFRLSVKSGALKGYSNVVSFYSGKMNIKSFGVKGDGAGDDTQKINEAIAYLHDLGGGTLLFSEGVYNVRTVHLKSNVYLFVDRGATIKALKGGDAPELTWFSDKKYRSGLSPTDAGPYADPENWLTKQDVGHHYFRNSMFFGERLDNVKIIGNGRITGNGNLVTGDRVMNNPPDNRSDKMFTLKLCTNVEIGGLYRADDLWYDPEKDEPYYVAREGAKDFNVENMLHIDRAGHFVLLATGTDNINVHDTYFSKHSSSNARDIYDFMACNNVTVTNIYSKVSSDDIVKPGSDCSLGFTRPARNYKVRNIIGDTNCNLFQIGSETADDIMDIHVDNIYVLGANKAGFSISTNDGAHIKDIHLNCGHTGSLHARSKVYRSTTPFFVSISNRGRILGANVSRFKFDENGEKHDELLVTNVNIGVVENIILNGIDIYEVYAGSSYSGSRWKPFDGTQRRASPIVAGYKLPDSELVEGGLNFKLPNGKHTGYIKNVVFNDVHVLVKGGNPPVDATAIPPELGVGQYNVSNLKIQPSYGLWARHVVGLTVKESTFNYEKRDSRYAIFLDDVVGAHISGVKMVRAKGIDSVIKLKNSPNVTVENASYYDDQWGNSPTGLPNVTYADGNAIVALPPKN